MVSCKNCDHPMHSKDMQGNRLKKYSHAGWIKSCAWDSGKGKHTLCDCRNAEPVIKEGGKDVGISDSASGVEYDRRS